MHTQIENQSQRKKIILYGLIACLLLSLFFIPLQTADSLLVNELVDASHIIAFMGISWFFFPLFPGSNIRKCIVFLLITMVLSVAIEVVQETVGRAFQWSDITRNFLGLGIGIAIRVGFNFFLIGLLVLLIIERFALLQLFAAHTYFHYNAPILASFNHKFEIVTWRPDRAEITLKGGKLLTLTKPNEIYSGAHFQDFPSKWEEYQQLFLILENPQTESIFLTIKITDEQHDLGVHHYDERFNQRLTLRPGVNHFKLELDSIRLGPKNRELNLNQVSRISFFLSEPSNGEQFLIDEIYLE